MLPRKGATGLVSVAWAGRASCLSYEPYGVFVEAGGCVLACSNSLSFAGDVFFLNPRLKCVLILFY